MHTQEQQVSKLLDKFNNLNIDSDKRMNKMNEYMHSAIDDLIIIND